MAGGPTHLVVGLLKKPHGVKGDVLVFPVTDEPETVFAPGRKLVVMDRDARPTGREVVVERSRAYHRAWLLHFAGMEVREALEELRERRLAIPIEEARPLDPGEFYMHELVGLKVATAGGEAVGVVSEVVEAPQGWLLDVAGDGKRHLIPFTRAVVERVDRAEGLVVIAPPAGLLEI
ncbi:MAG TPA: ribosome maturation factor RimM [Gemmatimonadales bacterium]|nr:ribosome maturation factor RimM [Gemmatimonadales bacterium]